MPMYRYLCFVLFVFPLIAAAENGDTVEALKKVIDANSVKELPPDLDKTAPPSELIDAAKTVVESADKIAAGAAATPADKRWALQRKAVSMIVLAYSGAEQNYLPLLAVEDQLEQEGLTKLATLVEKHILTIACKLAVRKKPADETKKNGVNLQGLADRLVFYAKTHPGAESEQLIDDFIYQIRQIDHQLMRDKRFAAVLPVFEKHYQEINHTNKAAALQPDIARSTLVGKPLVLFGMDLDNKPFEPASIKDKVVLVQFWGTWCVPCRAEIPDLMALYDKYHAQGLEIIGVNTAVKGDETPAAVRRWLTETDFGGRKIPWTVQLHEGLSQTHYRITTTQQYGFDKLPVLVLIGRNGKVISVFPLPSTLDDQISKALSPTASVEFTPEEQKKIDEERKKRESEEQKKIEEELME